MIIALLRSWVKKLNQANNHLKAKNVFSLFDMYRKRGNLLWKYLKKIDCRGNVASVAKAPFISNSGIANF